MPRQKYRDGESATASRFLTGWPASSFPEPGFADGRTPVRQSLGVETATQTLHRLTSYPTWEPDHGWEAPVADLRVLVDLKVNDVGVPAYASAHGGMPGAPVMVRSVAPLHADRAWPVVH